MSDFKPIIAGSVLGLTCGPRPSGVTVARSEPGKKAHLLIDTAMRFAPALYELAHSRQLEVRSDGRILIPQTATAPAADLMAVEGVVERGDRGGIAPGDYGGGVYTVAHTDSAWSYTVVCKPSGRASLKAVGTWTGKNNTFTVSHADAGRLATILDRVEKAKAKSDRKPVSLPELPNLSVRIEGAEILIAWPGAEDEAAILKKVPSLRWDGDRRVYAVSTRYRARTAAALEEIRSLRASAEKASAALRERLAANRLWHLTVTFQGRVVTASYPKSCDGAYQALGRLGRVKDRTVTCALSAETNLDTVMAALSAADAALETAQASYQREQERRSAERDARAAAVKNRIQVRADKAPAAGTAFRTWHGVVICTEVGRRWTDSTTGRDLCYAYWREATAAEAEAFVAAEASAPKTGSLTMRVDAAPAVGALMRLRSGMAVVVVGVSKPWYVDTARDEDVTSFYGSELWDAHVVDVDWRAASPEEASALQVEEAQAAIHRETLASAAAVRGRIRKDGTADPVGHVPAGEVLWEDTRHQAYGRASWLILAEDNRLWLVEYRGADGDSWGTYNCGYNTPGWCVRADDDTVTLLRTAAALTGFTPYRKETAT